MQREGKVHTGDFLEVHKSTAEIYRRDWELAEENTLLTCRKTLQLGKKRAQGLWQGKKQWVLLCLYPQCARVWMVRAPRGVEEAHSHWHHGSSEGSGHSRDVQTLTPCCLLTQATDWGHRIFSDGSHFVGKDSSTSIKHIAPSPFSQPELWLEHLCRSRPSILP